MDTTNRILLIVLSALAAVASLVGMLLAFNVITPGQLQSVIPYRAIADFYRSNLVAASLVSILALAVVLVLAVFWLRAQFAESVTAVTGGEYELRDVDRAHGETLVNYDAIDRAIEAAIKRVSGVTNVDTRIYSEYGGQLFAHTSLMVRRNANIHRVDEAIQREINREWLDRLGVNLARHDITIHLEPVEQRVA